MTFYQRLHNMARAYFPSHEADRDDLLQTVLIEGWSSGLLASPEIEYVEGEVAGKLAHLMHCRFIDMVRHTASAPDEPIEAAEYQSYEIDTNEIDLTRAIESLPPLLGRLVHRVMIEGYTLHEVARLEGRSYGSIWRELHAAKSLLIASLAGQTDPSGASEGS